MSPRSRGLISLCALLLAGAPVLAEGSSDSTLPVLGLVTNTGFCPDGLWLGGIWPGGRPEGLYTWGSYCSVGDEDTGRAESQEFLAPPFLNLYLAGYAGMPDRRLMLKNVASGQETELRPQSTGDLWQFNSLAVPADWVGKPVQLIAEDRATGQFGWLAFSLPFLSASSLLPAVDTTVPQGGFCPDGVYQATKWPGARPAGLATWGSYCKSGDAATGWAASPAFVAEAYLRIYTAGYPNTPGLRLAVENLQQGRQLVLQVPAGPGETWHLRQFRLPDEWIGQSVRIVAGDQATGLAGWVAFSEPVKREWEADAYPAASTMLQLFLLAIALLLPAIAACMFAAFRGVTDFLDLTATAFLALGLNGYAAFWIYFCSPTLGVLFSYAGLLACCGGIAYLVGDKSRRATLRPVAQLIAPTVLVLLASVFIVSLGQLYDVGANPITVSSSRFGPPGPPMLYGDNTIPKAFADAVYSGHIPKPLAGGWLSSDRPPLQTGNTLWIYAWARANRDLSYELLSVMLQCSCLAALWGFLAACNIDRRPMAMAIATCFLSGFTLLNAFFVWPKLYPVAFLLILSAYLLTDRYRQIRDRTDIGAMLGAAAAFAMLGHGGSVFAILGIAACMLFFRRLPSRRFLLALAAGAVILYLPWMLYQKFYDPPGDRLLKLHLAGVNDTRAGVSIIGLMINSYGKLSSHELIEHKSGNFKTLAGNLPQYFDESRRFGSALFTGPASKRNAAASVLQRAMFLYWIPSISFAILGPLALLAGVARHRRTSEFLAAARLWLLNALILVLWCVILFGPDSTGPRQGTYITEMLAFCGSCLAFWAVRPWLAVAMTAVQILWNVVLFVWLTPLLPPPGLSELRVAWGAPTGPPNVFLGAACVFSAAAMLVLLVNFACRRGAISQAEACGN